MKYDELIKNWIEFKKSVSSTIVTIENTKNIVYYSSYYQNCMEVSNTGLIWGLVDIIRSLRMELTLQDRIYPCSEFEISVERMMFNEEQKPTTFIHIKLLNLDEGFKDDPELFDQLDETYNLGLIITGNGKQKYYW